MAADEFITDFIGERWKVAFNKKKFPNPQTLAYNKVLWPIWEGKVFGPLCSVLGISLNAPLA
jgi:hypothetical protein